MASFNLTNYHTEYCYKIDDGNERKINDVCFAALFGSLKSPCTCSSEIFVNRDVNKVLKKSWNNYCFYNKHQLENHIRIIKRLFKFTSHIDEYDDHFTIKIKYSGNKATHKYILTWIRYAYEAPMNVMFLDIDRLKSEEAMFRFISKSNLFTLLSGFDWPKYRDVHCVPRGFVFYKFLTNAEIIDKLNRNPSFLNSIYNKSFEYLKPWIPVTLDTNINTVMKNYNERKSKYLQIYLKYYK